MNIWIINTVSDLNLNTKNAFSGILQLIHLLLDIWEVLPVILFLTGSLPVPKVIKQRGESLRPFSKYISAFEPDAESIPNKLFHNVHSRPEPYIYTETEVITLMDACESLFSPDGIRSRSVKYIIGLLWSTGMRPSEPINLRLRDIEFEKQIIVVRETKFAKERLIPVTNSVIQKIIIY